jgi:hypothetical protein
VDHIHGRTDLLNTTERPHMFAKELSLYIGYLEREINKIGESANDKQRRYVDTFRKNLAEGITYYEGLLPQLRSQGDAVVERFRRSLERYGEELEKMGLRVVMS